jgi:ABC-type Mn2+/Zn2+ transport system permease subunit
MQLIIEIIQIPFMQRALLGSVMLASLLGLFGTFIVPRKLGFMADGIAHASLLGIAIGIVLGGIPLVWAAAVAVVLGSILALVDDSSLVTHDSLIGVFLAGGMSAAIIIMSLTPGYKPELFSYLFGNILSITWSDIYLLTGFFFSALILFKYQWRTLVLTTIHRELSSVLGLRARATKYFLFVGTSVALIAGVKLLGIVLISALLIIPFTSANQVSHSLRSTIIVTQLFAISGSIAGIVLSYIFDLPTGPSVAIILVATFLVTLVAAKVNEAPIWKHDHIEKD